MNARSDGHPQAGKVGRYTYGVTWRQRRKPWMVKFKRNKKTVYVGSFFSKEAASYHADQYLRNEK